MAYAQVQVKADDITNPKFLYICTVRGCGADISLFPAAEKNPAPKKCSNCMDKTTREAIEAEYDSRTQKK